MKCKITNIECSECQPVCGSKEIKINKSEVYAKALKTYGAIAQIQMVFEEMAELQKELCKRLRGKPNKTNIAEEIADVYIVLEQMEQHFEIETQVKRFKEGKIERLARRLL